MRWLGFFLILLASTLSVSAEDWTTADGKIYKNVVVVAQEDDGVRITYDGGAGKIPYYELPLDLQKRFGQDYDSLEAKRKAAEKALDDATRSADAAAAATAQKQQQDAAAAAAAAAAQAKAHPNATPNSSAPAPPVVNNQPAPPANAPPPPQTPAGIAAQTEAKALYPASKFTYDEGNDICWLDSPAVNVTLVVPEATPAAASPAGSISLRIITDGRKPEAPDRIEGIFIPSGTVKSSGDSHSVKFLVDGTYIPITDLETGDIDQPSSYVCFYLTPEQAGSIFNAKNVNFSVGSINYMIDQTGIQTFRQYFIDVGHLPPPSSNIVRTYHKFLNRLPSIITIISTVCEYIILGSFAILVAASIAAFIMGVTRFIKM